LYRATPPTSSDLWRPPFADNDPVIFLEAKALYASKMDVPDGEIVDTLGSAKVLREGTDATVVALGAMVPKALAAAEELSNAGIECTVVDVRSLVPST